MGKLNYSKLDAVLCSQAHRRFEGSHTKIYDSKEHYHTTHWRIRRGLTIPPRNLSPGHLSTRIRFPRADQRRLYGWGRGFAGSANPRSPHTVQTLRRLIPSTGKIIPATPVAWRIFPLHLVVPGNNYTRDTLHARTPGGIIRTLCTVDGVFSAAFWKLIRKNSFLQSFFFFLIFFSWKRGNTLEKELVSSLFVDREWSGAVHYLPRPVGNNSSIRCINCSADCRGGPGVSSRALFSRSTPVACVFSLRVADHLFPVTRLTIHHDRRHVLCGIGKTPFQLLLKKGPDLSRTTRGFTQKHRGFPQKHRGFTQKHLHPHPHHHRMNFGLLFLCFSARFSRITALGKHQFFRLPYSITTTAGNAVSAKNFRIVLKNWLNWLTFFIQFGV